MATTVSLMLSVNCLKALLTQMKGRDRIWMTSRAHQWDEFIGLPHVGQQEIESHQGNSHQESLQYVGYQAALEDFHHAWLVVLCVERTNL